MTANPSAPYRHLGGSLPLEDPTYVVREADEQLYCALRNGEFCYVLNSRQMGKSSLRVRVMQRLQADGVACGVVDLSAMGTESTEGAWYKGLAYRILRNFRTFTARSTAVDTRPFDWRAWWREHDFLSPVQQLAELIEQVLLTSTDQHIIIWMDEIDSVLSLDFSTDDFFAWIRACYNNRADHLDYRRLTFCLLGVATPADLITDKKRTPFNVGRAIALSGFEFEQARYALQRGLIQAGILEPEVVLRQILDWTGGQPFLTQKLCQLVTRHDSPANSPTLASSLDAIVQAGILTNWESQDEPEHLRTIRDRFYAHPERTNRLLGLYQQILAEDGVKSDDSSEQRELRLTGLVVKRHNYLQVFNPIYRHIFDAEWVSQALADIRPYAQSLNQWLTSNGQDKTHLLNGVALRAATAWADGKSLSDQDYTYLAACQVAETEQVEAAFAAEAQAKRVLAAANRQANQRIKIGAGILGLATALLASSLLFSAQTVESARSQATAAQNTADQARLAALNSQAIANQEKAKAQRSRQAVAAAQQQTQKAKQTTQLARAEAQKSLVAANTALGVATAAKNTAQQAQRSVAVAKQDTRSAAAATQRAIVQRQQAEQRVSQARANLALARQQMAVAATQQRELTVGNQLERSALALIRTATRPTTDALIEAVRLGETLQPFLADGRAIARYPAVAPIFALQTLLTQMSQRRAVSRAGPVIDVTLEAPIAVWFSADASRYATLHSYDGFRAVYLQFWNDRGQPVGAPIAVDNGAGSTNVARPLALYLESHHAVTDDRQTELVAIDCDGPTNSQVICVKDFNQNLEHQQLERVPGVQAAFNSEKKELVTLDTNNVLRRWRLFDRGKLVGRPIAATPLPIEAESLYLTTDGRHLWTDHNRSGQQQIQVFDLEGRLVKTHPNPQPGQRPTPHLAISPEGELVGAIQLSTLPGQGRQLLTLPIQPIDAVPDVQFDFLQEKERIATVTRSAAGSGAIASTFQIRDLAGRLVSTYAVDNRSITIRPQPQGAYISSLECDFAAPNDFAAPKNCTGKVWDSEGQQITAIDVLSGGLKWTPQGKYLATWDKSKLRLTDVKQFTTLAYDTGGNLLAFQPDAPYFWTRQGTHAELWNFAARSPLASAYPLGLNAAVRATWYDALSQTMFVVSEHVEHGASLIRQPLQPADAVPEPLIEFGRGRNWVFNPQRQQIAVSKANGDLQLWYLNGNLKASFVGHTGAIDTVRFSPDGSQILTYSMVDRTARLWDLQGRQMAQYRSDRTPMMNADWSKIITIVDQPSLHPQIPQTQLKVWSIANLETLLADACQRLAPDLYARSNICE